MSLPEIVSLLHRLAEEIETRAMQEEAMNFWKEEKHMNIKQVQCLLTYLGYSPGGIDGANGPNTEGAVRAFQVAEGLTADGIAGTGTQAKLLDAVAGGRCYSPQETPNSQTSAAPVDAAQYLRDDGFYHIPRGVDVQLTRNFWAHEIHCQGTGCCTESVISKRILDLSQEIRDDLGEPLSIGDAGGSGYRCPIHNAEIRGASPKSLHTLSEAVDLHYKDPPKLKAAAKRHLTDGEIGLYSWGCHVGRWDRGYVSEFTG